MMDQVDSPYHGSKHILQRTTIILLIQVFHYGMGSKFCIGLNKFYAESHFGTWVPSNCTNPDVPLGSRCYLKCKENYIFKANANIELECGRYKGDNNWYGGSLSQCEPTPCPPIEVWKNSSSHVESWTPKQCQITGAKNKASCYFGVCPDNTQVVGLQVKKCLSNGSYTPVGGAFCERVGLPRLEVKCPPSDATINVDPGKNTGDATGVLGKPTGNFDETAVKLNIRSSSKDIQRLPVGRHYFQYAIEGILGQRTEYCSVTVIVKDDEPPVIETCPEEFEYIVPSPEKVKVGTLPYSFMDVVEGKITWIIQNSPVLMNRYLGVGEYNSTFVANDRSRNVAVCQIKVKVWDGGSCRTSWPPENANITFKTIVFNSFHQYYVTTCHKGTFLLCDIKLREAGLDLLPCNQVLCRKALHFSSPFISCAAAFNKSADGSCPPRTFVTSAGLCAPCPRSFFFDAGSKSCKLCPVNSTSESIGAVSCKSCPSHQMTKSPKGPRFCENICDDGYALDISTKTCSKCPQGTYVMPGGTQCTRCPSGTTTILDVASKPEHCVCGKVVSGNSGSVKLDIPEPNKFSKCTIRMIFSNLTSNPIYQRAVIRIKSTQLSTVENCTKSYVRAFGLMQQFETQLSEMKCGNSSQQPQTIIVRPWRSHFFEYSWGSSLNADLFLEFGIANCSRGEYYNLKTSSCTRCPVGTYQNIIGASGCIPCPAGKAATYEGSIKCKDGCRPGHIRNGTICTPCPIGYYQDGKEATSCIKCDAGLSTANTGTGSKSKCVTACSKGQFRSLDGNCQLCPIGTFQDEALHASGGCKYCPTGKVTGIFGATSSAACIDKCHYEGEFYNTLTSKCEKCPIGTYKLASPLMPSSCTLCPANYTTSRIGAVTIHECFKLASADNCKPNPCRFPGRCVDTGPLFKCVCPAMYTGRLCETALHPCLSNPCKSGGRCFNVRPSLYSCICAPGFTGKSCESKYLPCNSNPCQNGGNCTNDGNSYRCTCPPYFTGTNCDVTVRRPCQNRPCDVGKCVDGSHPGADPPYRCICLPDYTGKNCDTQIDDCRSNPCDSVGTSFCRDGVHSFYCGCKKGYEGSTCNISRACGPGRYFDSRCQLCPIGTFYPSKGYTESCLRCPNGATTLRSGTINESLCLDKDSSFKVKATFRVTSLTWNDSLAIRSSKLFQTTAERVKEQVKALYQQQKITDVLDIYITEFRRGSVLCSMTIYLGGHVTGADKVLDDAVKAGNIGTLTVDPKSLHLSTEKPKKEAKEDNKTRNIIIIVVVVVLLLIIGVTVFLLWYSKSRGARASFGKLIRPKQDTSSTIGLQSVQ